VAIIILGIFLAVSLGGMAAILAEGIDSTVRGSKDIFAVMQTQPIGTIPVVQNSVSRTSTRRRLLVYAIGFLVLAAAAARLIGMPG
jgi:hypothetical protein